MVTKWKKNRTIVSFIAFGLGISFILSSAVGPALGLSTSGRERQVLRDAFQKDYQNTAEFNSRMSDYLETFLTMAAGGDLYSQYEDGYGFIGYDVDYDIDYDIDYGDLPRNVSADSGVVYEGGGGRSWVHGVTSVENNAVVMQDSGGEAEEISREEIAKQLHERFKEDKNVLYSVAYDGQVKYTNAEDSGLSASAKTLPEGYNFLMYFDGARVSIVKDGKELDVYGAGVYTEDSEWFVPGYTNFPVDEKTRKATVCIAAAKQPVPYVKGNYSADGSDYWSNGLYQVQRAMELKRQDYVSMGIGTLLGAALLALYVALRKDKAVADRCLAGVTGRCWFEVKLLLLVLPLLSLFLNSGYALIDLYYTFVYSNMQLFGFMNMFANNAFLLAGFWTAYLFVNDLRYNERPWRHTLWGRMAALVWGAGFALPLPKRIVRRYGAVLAVQAVAGCVAVAVLGVYMDTYFYFYDLIRVLPVVFLIIPVSLIPGFLYAAKNREMAGDLGVLSEQIASIRAGNLKESVQLSERSDLRAASEDLNNIQFGMNEAFEEQTKSERMKVELITNVSHDLKTPLTSIITYAELLAEEENLPEHVKDYIRIMNDKAERLRGMVQDVFEVSKAASGQLPVELEKLDFGKLLRQTLADMSEPIEASPVVMRTDIPEEPVMIIADGKRLYRVFQNLIQNALKYSLEGSRVYLSLAADGRLAEASVKNISKAELKGDIEFTERFVRGDDSRSDGGSGLGLSIAENFTEACGGRLMIEPNADLFVVRVEFQQIPADRTGLGTEEKCDSQNASVGME